MIGSLTVCSDGSFYKSNTMRDFSSVIVAALAQARGTLGLSVSLPVKCASGVLGPGTVLFSFQRAGAARIGLATELLTWLGNCLPTPLGGCGGVGVGVKSFT